MTIAGPRARKGRPRGSSSWPPVAVLEGARQRRFPVSRR
ncbi:hypothetical protein SFR_4524 [Streptomyces sp. FR-008]|nr:hypothetical protein SFR_4524 [Streptomyces sp. FR-008]